MTEVPEALTGSKVEAQVLRHEVWNRINRRNQHYMAALVGPEGSGKSWTALKIAEVIDPTFDADRVMFDPHTFMEQLTAWKDAGETRGKMIVVASGHPVRKHGDAFHPAAALRARLTNPRPAASHDQNGRHEAREVCGREVPSLVPRP